MSNGNVVDIGFWQLASAYLFVLLLLGFVRWRGINREKEILISSVRMTLQLVLVASLLTHVFANDHPVFPLSFLLVMLLFAVNNIIRRVKVYLSSPMKWVIAVAMAVGTGASIAYFILVVLMLDPWYSSRHFIPIAGMIVGNSMTGISLGVNHLIQGVHKQRTYIEGALMLGAEPRRALKCVTDEAFDAAILPTINSMVGMGIVFLPGMMTGQILVSLACLLRRWAERSPVTRPAGRQPAGKSVIGNNVVRRKPRGSLGT